MNAKELGEWVGRTVKPGHVVPLIGLGMLLSCCGPCALFWSCIPSRPAVAKSASEFTAEEREVADALKISQWPKTPLAARMTSVEYIAAKLHPEDSPAERSERIIHYVICLDNLSTLPEWQEVRLEKACFARDLAEELKRGQPDL